MVANENNIPLLHLQDFDANLGYQKGLEDGIKIGTKTMINKACEWISQAYTNGILDLKNCDDIINNFKKAMEK